MKIKLKEERLMKKSQADEDGDYMFLTSLLPSIKILDDFQRLELRIEFLSSVTGRIQIDKNRSLPFNSFPTASNSSCPTTPSPRAANLDSTHSRDSDTSTHTLQISCISSADLLPRQFRVPFWELIKGYPYCRRKMVYQSPFTQLYTLKNLGQIS